LPARFTGKIRGVIQPVGSRRASFEPPGDDTMLNLVRWTLALGTILLVCSFSAVQSAEGDEMVTNPYYRFWANCKPGSTVTLLEKTVFTGPEKEQLPDGTDTKEVTSTLLAVSPDHVTVKTTVLEYEFLGAIESAPTKKIYPAKVKQSHLRAGLHGIDPKRGEETLEALGQKLACHTLAGTEKKEGTEVVHKVWLSEKVPGGIVKHHRVTKQDGKVVADTTIVVKSFKKAE
jgi:hypothetical protein